MINSPFAFQESISIDKKTDDNDTILDLWRLFPNFTTIELAALFDYLKAGKVRGLVITHKKD